MRGSFLVATLALAPALLPASARAAEPAADQRAALRRKFDQAIEFTRQKQWLEALELLRAIAREKDTGGVRFYMAMCEENLAQLRAAEASYEAAMRLAPAMGVDEAVIIARKSEEALERLRPRIPQVTLRADPAPAGLAVSIDGRALSADELARPVPHDPGEARVKATAPGHTPFERTLTLAEGARLSVDLTLPPAAAAAPPPVQAPLPPPPPPPPPARWPAYLTGAVALGAAGTGVGFYLRHRRLDDETDRVCAEALRCDPARQDRLALYRNVALASAGVAVAAGVVTVVLWRSSSETQVAVGSQSVALTGRW